MDCLAGSDFPKRVLKRRCTTVSQFVLLNSSTQNAFSTAFAAIFPDWSRDAPPVAYVIMGCSGKTSRISLQNRAE
jgi:hypothetical protein